MALADPIADVLQAGVAEHVFPGAVLAAKRDGRLYLWAAGIDSCEPPSRPVTAETIYDLASLTKPLATAAAVLILADTGQLRLDEPIGQGLRELRDCPVGKASLRELLNHSSGLPGWRPLFERIHPRDREAAVAAIGREPLEYPPGSRSLYSDLGFILLGVLIERTSSMSLDLFCRAHVFGPLNAGVDFGPVTRHPPAVWSGTESVAATEYDPRRGRLLRGEVHDDNAAALGGVAGHAGLFGSAPAVLTLADAWLSAYDGVPGVLRPDLVRDFVHRQPTPGSSWALGWDTRSTPSSSGRYFSPIAFGHLGFTGTSLWIDPAARLEVALLSNRVHYGRENTKIHAFRPRIHDAVYEQLVMRE